MNEEKLEQLLKEFYLQDIVPSEKLVQKTKRRLSGAALAVCMTALAVLLNLAAFLAFIGFVIVAPYSLMHKIVLCMAISCIYNSLALAAYLYKERVSEFFQRLQGGYYEQQ